MVQLKEDFGRLDRGKKLETQLGREILDSQVRNTRRVLEVRRLLEKIPAFGLLLASFTGIITAIILFAKGQFYNASKNLQPQQKKKGGKKSFDPIEQAQKISSKILETAGDNIEILIATVTIAFYIYKKKK